MLVDNERNSQFLPLPPLRSDPRPQSYVDPLHQNLLNSKSTSLEEFNEKHQEKIGEQRDGFRRFFRRENSDLRHTRSKILPDFFVYKRLRNNRGNLPDVHRNYVNIEYLDVNILDVIDDFYNEMILPFLLEKYSDQADPRLKFQDELLDDFERKVIFLSFLLDDDKINYYVLNIIDRFRYLLKNDNIHIHVMNDAKSEIRKYNWKIMQVLRHKDNKNLKKYSGMDMEMINELVESFLSQESRRKILDQYMSSVQLTQNSELLQREQIADSFLGPFLRALH